MFQRIITLIITLATAAIIGGIDYVSDLFFPEEQLVPEIIEIVEEDIEESIVEEVIEKSATEETVLDPGPPENLAQEFVPEEITPAIPEPVIKPPIVIPEITIEVLPPPEIEEKEIKSESIVGLNCFYKHRESGSVFNTGRGSGVIIHPQGYVLTARHVVDFGFGLTLGGGTVADFNLANQSDFNHCNLGIAPKGTSLPDADLIRRINPSTQLPVLGFTAQIAQPLPPYAGKSYGDMLAMDFAVLHIDGVSKDGPIFGVSSLPASFTYSEILTEESFPPIGDEILTYGFPGDTTAGKQSTFNTLFLVGSVGFVDKIFADGFIQTVMEISGGRSGSPLFWKGRVAGVVTSYVTGNRTLSQSLGISVMLDSIRSFLP